MRGWRIMEVGKRKLAGKDNHVEYVVRVAADNGIGVLKSGDLLRISPLKRPPCCPLTRRQYETVCHLAEGKSIQETALVMHVVQSTVRDHLNKAYKRVNIRGDRAMLVITAYEEGWI